MPSLSDLQKSFSRVVHGVSQGEELTDEIVGGGLSVGQRLQIHRHTYEQSLTEALLAVFPLCEAFVGGLFLKEACRRFVEESPPNEPVLYRYGEGFPGFLRTYEPAGAVPYVADVAKLEWHTHELMNQHEEKAPSGQYVSEPAAQEGRVFLHADARLLKSDFPIFDLWQAVTGQIEPEDVRLENNPQSILVMLSGRQVHYQLLEQDQASALQRVLDTGTLNDTDLDPLADLMGRGVLEVIA